MKIVAELEDEQEAEFEDEQFREKRVLIKQNGWVGQEKHTYLTEVSLFVGIRDNEFVVGQAVLKAESSKIAKHEKACLENQHVFIPFAFDTFGSLDLEAVEFLNRVQWVMNSSLSTFKGRFVFSRIGFAIQKGIAAQLVARLSTTCL
ncbi:uncharacterized protein LOC110883387 [Helianthus annuus]|uniref:uncharacterized protein LOC110883387 n=1 Tax=Helianthus annuus TaxID=4232 RepID=UPI000B8F70D4|nr:uncharacterized protein LOC110883387 [Helianthus annuus]